MERLPYDVVKADREREAAAKAEREQAEHEASAEGHRARARSLADSFDEWAGGDPWRDDVAEIVAGLDD